MYNEKLTHYKNYLDALLIKEKSIQLSLEERFIIRRIHFFFDAVRLGLKYFRYSGGTLPETLEFCRNRDGQIFSIDEMFEWSNSNDCPKKHDYDPVLHLGAYKCFKGELHCNHIARFISNEMAYRERPELRLQIKIDKMEINLPIEVLNKIELERNRYLSKANWIQEVIVNAFFDKLITDMSKEPENLTYQGEVISIDEALKVIAPEINKVFQIKLE
jgi:hypothetical protein